MPEIVPLSLKTRKKNRNQRVHTEGLISRGLIRGVTQVLRQKWAYLRGYTKGGGEIRYLKYDFSESFCSAGDLILDAEVCDFSS